MNKFVLLALVGCSLAVFLHAVVSEEPFESAAYETEQASYFRAVKDETVDSPADERFEDDLNDDKDSDQDEEFDDDEEEEDEKDKEDSKLR